MDGNSQYNLKKMFMFALDGITAFSIVPMRLASFCGLFVSIFCFVYTVYAIAVRLLGGFTVRAGLPCWSEFSFWAESSLS